MAKRKNNNFLKLGDVIEIKVDGKLAYAQFVNDEVKDNGAFVNVFSGLYTGRPCLESILSSEAKFQIFLHVIYEFEHTDHLLVIGNAPVSEKFQKLPSMFKTYNDWETGREWFLEYLDGKEFSAEEYFGSHAKNLKKLGAILPKEFHNLPTSGMIYYDELVTRILAKGTNSYDAENGPMQRSPLEDDASDTHIKKDVANENKPIYPGINPISKILQKLLNRLDSIAVKHEEIYDTQVREELHTVIFRGFINLENEYQLPNDFGLFNKAANKRIHSALTVFFLKALVLVKENDLLQDRSHRITAFQDDAVASTTGSKYDDYFGYYDTEI